MTICQQQGCQQHYGCRLRNKGIRLSNAVTSTRTKNMRPTPFADPVQNAQIMYDERPGGTKMPFLNDNGTVLRHKQWRENKAGITDNIRRIRTYKPEE